MRSFESRFLMNRTNLLLGILSLVFASCADEQPQTDYTGFVDKQITLIGKDSNYNVTDTLAILSIKIPPRLDTFYKWYHNSDCSNCGELKYRFADRRYPQFAEAGFFWTVEPDSVYQFSVWHKPFSISQSRQSIGELNIGDSGRLYRGFPVSMGDAPPFYKEFKKINGRNFIIVGFDDPYGYLTRKETRYIVATTHLNDREIFFIAECSGRDTINFFWDMKKSIESIYLNETSLKLKH